MPDADAGADPTDDSLTALPVVDPPERRVDESRVDEGSGTEGRVAESEVVESRVAGIVLAAGTSSRFGDSNKLLVDVDGEPMVRRSVVAFLDAGLDPVVVVLGHEADRVRGALDGLDVRFVANPDYESGQASSLRTGIRAVDAMDGRENGVEGETDSMTDTTEEVAPVDAAVVGLGDMPDVDPVSVTGFVAAYEAGQGSALAAGYDGVRGNPVLFDRRYFATLADAGGDVGGRDVLLGADDAAVVETGDPGVRRDVDRPSDLDGE